MSTEQIKQLEARIEELSRALSEAQAKSNGHNQANTLSPHDTDTILETSQLFTQALNINDVYVALASGVMSTEAERCVIYDCKDIDPFNVPKSAQAVFIKDRTVAHEPPVIDQSPITVTDYPTLYEMARDQTPLVINDVATDSRLAENEREFFRGPGIQQLIVVPLVVRNLVSGFLSVEYYQLTNITNRVTNLHRILASQATIAIDNARQVERTATALTETQSLYRAGRVLASTDNLQETLEEALIEFVYSLGLNQGGITLLTADRLVGQLMAYVENGELQDVERLRFEINEEIPYQQILLSGQPFVSPNVPDDPRMVDFISFNTERTTKSLMEAPLILHGEIIGWIGVDAVDAFRDFSQREIDLARAMADQIAIAIQNHRLLEQTKRRAEQFRTVAEVGEAVSGLMDLGEVLNRTVDLIRNRFGFYHVSIFLLDDAREWAVVRASTGEVGKIMVERPHRLQVGGKSIVGFATYHAKPRIALDVGADKVHFNNPLLPDTRSEMGLPLISRGTVIGALDVQSVEPNAFSDEDVATLQIMADQLATAIENARLFGQTQRRLMEQGMLYNIGTRMNATLNLQESADVLVTETANTLNAFECALLLLEEDDAVYVISNNSLNPESPYRRRGQRLALSESETLSTVFATKQELIVNLMNPAASNAESAGQKSASLTTALAIVPVLLRDQVIAFLEVYDDNPNRRFSQEDISLLDSLALQTASSIETARLFSAARENQAFLKSIIDELPDPIFIKDRNYTWAIVNRAFAEGVLGMPEEEVIGRTDHELASDAEAEWFREQDQKTIETGEIQEIEELVTDHAGNVRTFFTRRIPLYLGSEENGTPDYLIGIINDITEQRTREAERERLMQETQRNLATTASLYRLSSALATGTEARTVFEIALGEYLTLLGLEQGSLMRYDKGHASSIAVARYIEGVPVEPAYNTDIENDKIYAHLQAHPEALIIPDTSKDPLVKDSLSNREQYNVESMLFIPILVRGTIVGSLVVDALTKDHVFSHRDIEMGQAIADQLAVWLESQNLLSEAQHRSELLSTAAEVSRAASSILDAEELVERSVNLIRDHFHYYYVGLFLVDERKEWAVLRAGTGEAGRKQLARHHRLEIGGKSMIGWSVANRKARIALDVGEEAVRFQNPDLPDTHSEMALPLVSRDEAIGALTVQSVERGAFSDEDVTLLQTMADQLANALTNAQLYESAARAQAEAENRLQDTLALQALSQKLSGMLQVNQIVDAFFEACTQTLGFDFVVICLVDTPRERVRGFAAIGTNEDFIRAINYALDSSDIVADIIRTGNTEIFSEWDERFLLTPPEKFSGTHIFTPIVLRQENIGTVEVGYNDIRDIHTDDSLMRLLRAFIDQTALAMDNAQSYEATQKAARREAIIREITGKIRGSVNVDDILQTTVTELGKFLGASRGGITLNVDSLDAPKPSQRSSGNGS